MTKNLVIVESPAKAKTIEKFLGKDFKVMSSHGHIRDLKKRNLSVDVDNDFAPIYEIPTDKKALVAELKKAAADARTVWLASDEDREGEAIAWHLAEVLGLDPATTRRIVFHEITEEAIRNAIATPRTIDLNRVDAQQARRVLDRIVGFELSPVLWRKIKPALSAGRVQSVAVRLVADREKEIEEFKPEAYYRVTAEFTTPDGKPFTAELNKRLPGPDEARAFLGACRQATFGVTDIHVRPVKKSPAPPFTTSTLQQEAARKLGFPVNQTMRVAQKLYEEGLITYMRTDSLNLSNQAVAAISGEIKKQWGKDYVKNRTFHTTSKGAQEAHEAIRPTYFNRHSIQGTAQEQKLYDLIWKRAVASQMADALLEKTTVQINSTATPQGYHFNAEGEVVKFDGFLKLYLEGNDDERDESNSSILPEMKTGLPLTTGDITATERFTQQPPRYTEAALVKKLEELGIGRPSTYAPTIQTIIDREYIERGAKEGTPRTYDVLKLKKGKITASTKTENTGAEKGKFVPTDTGRIVNDYLTRTFPDILDYNFTANIEARIDGIATGEYPWQKEIDTFYKTFHPAVDAAMSERAEHKPGERLLGTHPETGEPVYVKIGRFGPMVQIGDSTDKEVKPRFASLLKGQSMQTLTLEDALALFKFPRVLGEIDGKEVSVSIGRFGPYVKHGSLFASLPKDVEPAQITLQQAAELIAAKQETESKKVIQDFPAQGVQVLNGRYGPYIAKGRTNYKIPKTAGDPASLTIEQINEIIAKQDAAPQKKTRGRASKK